MHLKKYFEKQLLTHYQIPCKNKQKQGFEYLIKFLFLSSMEKKNVADSKIYFQ
jgi:hypothetical protein